MLAVYLLSIMGFNVHHCSHNGTSVTFLVDDSSRSSCCCSQNHGNMQSTGETILSKTSCCSDEASFLTVLGSSSDDYVQLNFTPSLFIALHSECSGLFPTFGWSAIVRETSPPGIVKVKDRAILCNWRA